MKGKLTFGLIASLCFLSLPSTVSAQLLGYSRHLCRFSRIDCNEYRSNGPLRKSRCVAGQCGYRFAGIIYNGVIHAGDAMALQAQAQLVTAYDVIAGEAFSKDLTGQDLGGMILTPGVYRFSSSAFLTGTLTLDALGNPDARFDFQIGSTLITASNSWVSILNGGDPCKVFWQVGSSATLGTDTRFRDPRRTSITMNTGATIIGGSALANGAVTLN